MIPNPAAAAAAGAAVPKIKQRKFANGDKYVGGWLKGLPEGEGKYEWADGSSYEGGWKAGAKHGVGRYIWHSGASYQGEWQNGCMQGIGFFEAPDGSKYQGGWKEDLKHGLGKKVYANGDVYEGMWAAGKPDGPGRYIWVDFNEYDGEWKEGRMDGQGTFVWKTGERYDGEWTDGQENGVGVFTFRDGSMYSGFWRAGKKHGVGISRPAALSASPAPTGKPSISFARSASSSKPGAISSASVGGGRAAFADKAAEAAALPDEAAAEVLSHTNSAVKYGDCTVEGGVKTAFEKNDSTIGAQQPLSPSQGPSNTVLVKEYKEGKLMYQYPLKGAKLAAVCAALNNATEKQLSSTSGKVSSGSSKGQGPLVAPLGEVVYKQHSVYDLMVQLRLGIRWSVTARSLEPCPVATVQLSDYSATYTQEFPRSGSRTTPVHPAADFVCKDYAPAVFKVLRELSGVSQHEYVSQLCSDQALRLLASPNSPGSLVFLSRDEKFMLRSVSRAEARLLMQMLPFYTQHVARHPDSMLVKFYGLHRIWLPYKGGKKVHFVVMQNVLCSDLIVHRRYDLKGSTVGRSIGEEAAEADMTTVLKDLDLHHCFKLEEGLSTKLKAQLEADTQLLASQGIMDYSMLLGVHYRGLQGQQVVGQSPTGNFRHYSADADLTAALVRLQQQLATLQLESRLAAALMQLGKARMLGGLHNPSKRGGSGSSSGRLALIARSPTLVLATRQQAANSSSSSSKLDKDNGSRFIPAQQQKLGHCIPAVAVQPLQAHKSGTAADGDRPNGEDVVLFFGIIDILQEYTIKKKMESIAKRLTAPAASISAVAPKYYANRFRKFMAQAFN